MADEPLVIDVQLVDSGQHRMGEGVVVVVEPLYGSVAIASALDAGWASVEVQSEWEVDTAPIPLVSFEQRPPVDAASTRCRVRCDDFAEPADEAANHDAIALVGCPANARPLAAAIGRTSAGVVTFLLAPCQVSTEEQAQLTSDAFWAAGMLIRILLEELDDRPSRLTDAAGIAVTIAQGAEDAAAQLSAGVRWRRHLERGGHPDDLRIASAVDTIGVVPELVLEGETIIARPWGIE